MVQGPPSTGPRGTVHGSTGLRAGLRITRRLSTQPPAGLTDLLGASNRSKHGYHSIGLAGTNGWFSHPGNVGGQWAANWGRHHLILRGRAALLAGDVRFWDDVPLAGDYQRVFFSSRYWVHDAVQLETAYRMSLWRSWFAVGVFHDGSLFMDRSLPVHGIAGADAFGPSLHFLLLDTFALDVYAGFGFAPVGFDQTLTFAMQTIF